MPAAIPGSSRPLFRSEAGWLGLHLAPGDSTPAFSADASGERIPLRAEIGEAYRRHRRLYDRMALRASEAELVWGKATTEPNTL